MRQLQCLLLLFLTLSVTGCERRAASNTFGLPTKELKISGKKIVVEIADTEDVMKRGLMFRESLPDGTGMLFIYPEPRQVGFWMKNTKVALSIGFITSEGILQEIYDMKPLDETSVKSKSSDIKYAIEVPQGWFDRVGIKPGAKVQGL